jgi:hypothetical protein
LASWLTYRMNGMNAETRSGAGKRWRHKGRAVKIFWSWQSDTPGKTGRHFVRDVLQAVVDDLKQSLEVKERAAIHLDHDRKGVRGSPDLARVILEKIEQSVVFVADVTPVGITVARQGTLWRA